MNAKYYIPSVGIFLLESRVLDSATCYGPLQFYGGKTRELIALENLQKIRNRKWKSLIMSFEAFI